MMKDVAYQRFSPQQPPSKKPKFVISSGFEGWTSKVHIWEPPTDLIEIRDAYIVRVEIAGMRDAEFIISMEKRSLVIKGTRSLPDDGGAYHRLEISSGEFVTGVDLPGPVEYEAIEAVYSDGFLRVVLPKAFPSQIEVSG
jgi:HSP20 family protein